MTAVLNGLCGLRTKSANLVAPPEGEHTDANSDNCQHYQNDDEWMIEHADECDAA